MKAFTLGLWANERKDPSNDTSPDATGSLNLPLSVVGDILRAYQAKTLATETLKDGTEVLKLRAVAWQNRSGDRRPLINIQINNLQEQLEANAARAARQNQQQDNNGGGGFGINNGMGGNMGGGFNQTPPPQQQGFNQAPPQQQGFNQAPPQPAMAGATLGNGMPDQALGEDIPF